MNVWLCLPSARPVAEVNARMDLWRAQGYKIALWRDRLDGVVTDFRKVGAYPGYAQTVNYLARTVLWHDQQCDWIIAAGDDTDPDPTRRAAEIARECSDYFLGSFGVMQPTGDPWSDNAGRIIERIAGSPWLGREWCFRAYGARGPLWPGYTHCFADEELQLVAQRLGVFWQRPDLTHLHHNWARPKPGGPPFGAHADMPEFLADANSVAHWQKYSRLFAQRKAAGFPGSEVA